MLRWWRVERGGGRADGLLQAYSTLQAKPPAGTVFHPAWLVNGACGALAALVQVPRAGGEWGEVTLASVGNPAVSKALNALNELNRRAASVGRRASFACFTRLSGAAGFTAHF